MLAALALTLAVFSLAMIAGALLRVRVGPVNRWLSVGTVLAVAAIATGLVYQHQQAPAPCAQPFQAPATGVESPNKATTPRAALNAFLASGYEQDLPAGRWQLLSTSHGSATFAIAGNRIFAIDTGRNDWVVTGGNVCTV